MTLVLIALGSNVDKEQKLPAAVALLRQHPRLQVLAVSPTYVTTALAADGSHAAQADFHNAAVLAETDLSAGELRAELRTLETALGRVRTADKFAPRPIDLDIAFFGDAVLDLDGKHVPDPNVLRYAHIAVPLAAVAPDFAHPETGQTLAAIAATFGIERMEIAQ